jgi:hypothetical protein
MIQRRSEAWVKWRSLVLEQEESGQSVVAFCRSREIPKSQFYYWKRRQQQAVRPPFVEMRVAQAEGRDSGSVPGSTIEVIGLPSLHTLDGAQSSRIWLATEATDMRCGFDRLAERVRAVIGQDPLSGHLFEWPHECTHQA